VTDPIPYPPSPNDPAEPMASPPVVALKSPTGQPLIPPKAVPYLVGVCAAAEIVAQVAPAEHWSAKVAHIIAGACLLLGISSPGLRRK
jgi:hypothetical protein